jgi:hypothetical protein
MAKNGTGNGHDQHFEIAAKTLSGDLRDAFLTMIKQQKKPWEKLSEHEQRNVANGISTSCHEIVMRAVELIRAEGRPRVSCRVEKVTIDDKGTKLAIGGVAPTDDTIVDVAHMQGRRVVIIEVDHGPFVGERAPFKPQPDQRALIEEPAGAEA